MPAATILLWLPPSCALPQPHRLTAAGWGHPWQGGHQRNFVFVFVVWPDLAAVEHVQLPQLIVP